MMDRVNVECPACASRNDLKKVGQVAEKIVMYIGTCEACGVMISMTATDAKDLIKSAVDFGQFAKELTKTRAKTPEEDFPKETKKEKHERADREFIDSVKRGRPDDKPE